MPSSKVIVIVLVVVCLIAALVFWFVKMHGFSARTKLAAPETFIARLEIVGDFR